MTHKQTRPAAVDTSGTVVRTLAVLTLMAERGGPVGVSDVASALGLPMSTSHRLLDLLRGSGFVARDAAQRRYRPGLEFLRVAALVARTTSFATLCQPALDRIAAQTGETALFGEYSADRHLVAYAAKSDSGHSLRYLIPLFEPAPVECGASGLAVLAFLPAPVRQEICRAPRAAPLSGRRPAGRTLAARIATVRRQGFAFSTGEKLPESVGIAVPVRLAEDAPVGSLTLTIPQSRFSRARLKAYVALLAREAEALSAARTP